MDGLEKGGKDVATPYKPGEKPLTDVQKAAAAASIASGQKAADELMKGVHEPTLGSFKHGGVVPKTGNYKLHEGERVRTMAQEEKMAESLETGKKKETKSGEKRESKAPKKKEAAKPVVHHMSIHKVKGGHIVHHHHEPHEEGDGRKPDATHVVPNGPGGEGDTDNLTSHIEEHMGAPNAGEAETAQSGAPDAAAGPAGPAAGAAPAMANLAPAGA